MLFYDEIKRVLNARKYMRIIFGGSMRDEQQVTNGSFLLIYVFRKKYTVTLKCLIYAARNLFDLSDRNN